MAFLIRAVVLLAVIAILSWITMIFFGLQQKCCDRFRHTAAKCLPLYATLLLALYCVLLYFDAFGSATHAAEAGILFFGMLFPMMLGELLAWLWYRKRKK